LERIKQQLEVARKQREQLQHEHTTSAEGVGHRERNPNRSNKNRFITLKDNNMRFLMVMVALIVLVTIIWWSISGQEPGRIRLSDSDLLELHQTSAAGSSAFEKLEVRIADLIKHLDVLTESVTHLESKLISAHLIADTIIEAEKELASSTSHKLQAITEAEQIFVTPPPADTGQSRKETNVAKTLAQATDGIATKHQDRTAIDATASIESHTTRMPDSMVSEPPASLSSGADTIEDEQPIALNTPYTATSKAAVMEDQEPVTKAQPAVSVDKNGPWVINLVSTSNKADADRLAKKALSRDIQTEQQQITVKGTQYWRVQIIGFSTKEQANAYADIAKEKLGLKDVWIMKR